MPSKEKSNKYIFKCFWPVVGNGIPRQVAEGCLENYFVLMYFSEVGR